MTQATVATPIGELRSADAHCPLPNTSLTVGKFLRLMVVSAPAHGLERLSLVSLFSLLIYHKISTV